ncbi:MAG: amidohydrolase family protein [Rhizobiaceae bacterium]
MFFSCAHHSPETDHGHAQTVKHKSKHLTVDIHCHVHVPAADNMVQDFPEDQRPPAQIDNNPLTAKINRKSREQLMPKLIDPLVRIQDMDAQGVDIQALSPSPYQYNYAYPADFARETSQVVNNRIAEFVASYPDRFVGLGTVPLQNAEIAVAELDRCIDELGFKGIEINSHVNGQDLTRADIEPFFARAEERGIVLFLHPIGTSFKERFGENYFRNLIGHPLESALAVGHLVFDGYLERYPGLKICVAHGGGYIPAYAGRFDHPFDLREDCRQNISKPPSEYIKKLYFDTVVFTDHQLKYLVDVWGADRIVMGTDYPYDMAEPDPVGHVQSTKGLSEDQEALILGENAAALLNLDPDLVSRLVGRKSN